MTTLPLNEEFVKRAIHVTEEYEKLWGRWHSDSQLLHIITEIAEVKDVLRNKNKKYGNFDSPEFKATLLDELADVGLTWLATNGFLRITSEELNDALEKKLKVVENRLNQEKERLAKESSELIKKVIK